MVFIFGGAYQGMLEYAYENYGATLSVFQCSESNLHIDFTKDIINAFHLLTLAHVKNNIDTLSFINENLDLLKDKIIICEDIGNGVVPIEKESRFWREATGRCMTLLSRHSDEVIRIFCGLGMRIK